MFARISVSSILKLKYGSIASLLIGLLFTGIASSSAKEPQTTTAKLRAKNPESPGNILTLRSSPVSLALAAAKEGDMDNYQAIISQALRDKPNDPLIRAQVGQVKNGKSWTSVEEAWDQPSFKTAWKEYRRLRDHAKPTVESQMAVAGYCKKTGLKDQERVHLYAVLDIEPNNANVRERLGFKRVGDEWMLPAEIEAAKKQAADIARIYREEHVTLEHLNEKLIAKKIERSAAVEQMVSHIDIAVIPTWELIFAKESEEGALTMIDALKQIPAPEASVALVRQAVSGISQDVKQTAIEALRSRDLYSYVPVLLRELKSPWISSFQVKSSPGRQLFVKHSFFADGQDKQEMMVLDHTFRLRGDRSSAQGIARNEARSLISSQEEIVEDMNRTIGANNKVAMDILAGATGVSNLDAPQDWWGWWNDKNDSYYLDKTVQTQTSVTSSDVEVPVSSSSSTTTLTVQPRSLECLPAGTKIWTSIGKIDIDRIKVGDSVLSQNMNTGELLFKPVLRTTVREPSRLMVLQFDHETIRATEGHPFWVIGKGWTRAKELQPGMLVHTEKAPVAIIEVKQEEKIVKTFNLVVEENHNYFVGERGILSHDIIARTATASIVPGLAMTAENLK